jgi:hypothetical protein
MGDPKVRATIWEKYVKCSKSTQKVVKVPQKSSESTARSSEKVT